MFKEPIRVLQVLTIMNRGGAENMIMNYYRNIDRSRIQFDFLLHRNHKGAFDDEIKKLGGKIHLMPAISPGNYFRYIKALSIFFDKHPEYKIIHSHLNALSSIILKVAKKKNIPTRIAHSHLAVEPLAIQKVFSPNTDIKATIKDSFQSMVRYRTRKYATHYFACGNKAALWLYGKKNQDKVTIINNAIDSYRFSFNQKMRKKIRSQLQFNENSKVIVHVGRFNEQKNHFFLIDIFNHIAHSNPSTHLALIGDGHLRPKIEKQVLKFGLKENVHFLGLRDNISELLQAMDLFLFPSLYEGLPLTLVEAQAAGLRIVASNTITKEVDLTGLITFKDLGDSSKEWAESVLDNLDYYRENTYDHIVNGYYDIHSNVKSLQQFYLNPF